MKTVGFLFMFLSLELTFANTPALKMPVEVLGNPGFYHLFNAEAGTKEEAAELSLALCNEKAETIKEGLRMEIPTKKRSKSRPKYCKYKSTPIDIYLYFPKCEVISSYNIADNIIVITQLFATKGPKVGSGSRKYCY